MSTSPSDHKWKDVLSSGFVGKCFGGKAVSSLSSLIFLLAMHADSVGAATYSETIMEDAPFAYYRLNETDNTLPVADEAGNNPGTYQNGPKVGVAGALNGDARNTAVSFDRTRKQHARLTNLGDFGSSMTSGFTIEYWLKTSDGIDYQAILGTADKAGFVTDFLVDIAYGKNRDQLRLYYRDDHANRYEATFSSKGGNIHLFNNAWHHIVQVYNPAEKSLDERILFYVDGQRQKVTVAQKGGAPASSNFNEPLTLGAFDRRGTLEGYLHGSLDEVAFYKTSLSEARIEKHYQAATGHQP